jgi:hypothetical protein
VSPPLVAQADHLQPRGELPCRLLLRPVHHAGVLEGALVEHPNRGDRRTEVALDRPERAGQLPAETGLLLARPVPAPRGATPSPAARSRTRASAQDVPRRVRGQSAYAVPVRRQRLRLAHLQVGGDQKQDGRAALRQHAANLWILPPRGVRVRAHRQLLRPRFGGHRDDRGSNVLAPPREWVSRGWAGPRVTHLAAGRPKSGGTSISRLVFCPARHRRLIWRSQKGRQPSVAGPSGHGRCPGCQLISQSQSLALGST